MVKKAKAVEKKTRKKKPKKKKSLNMSDLIYFLGIQTR